MLKQFYIRRNLRMYDEIKALLFSLSDLPDLRITDNLTVGDIRLRMTDEYEYYISLRKNWEFIREDKVLLTALRDGLKHLDKIDEYNSKAG